MRLNRIRQKIIASRYTYRPTRKSRVHRIVFISVFIAFIIAAMSIFRNIEPVLIQMAESDTSDAVAIIINDAVNQAMIDGNLDYEDLVTLTKDSDGRVTALTANMTKINAFQSGISNSITNQLNKRGYQIVKIPVGNIIGGVMFSGRGPSIPVKILALTSVVTNFRNSFEEAGINQTQHRIMLDVTVELDIMVPNRTISVSVPTELVVAETIIVGEVPKSYTDLSKYGLTAGENS